MTCIVGIKGKNNNSTVISDIRLTDIGKNDHYDSVLKFIQFDNRLTLFMAGPVFLLGEIEQELPNITQKLTYDNCDDHNSPLIECILTFYEKQGYPKEADSAFICNYVDIKSNSHKMFRFDIINNSEKWEIQNLISDTNNKWEVIGSGRVIAERNLFPHCVAFELDKVFDKLLDSDQDISDASIGIQKEIENRFESLGKNIGINIYEELGVSPIFYRALIKESTFALVAEEKENISFDNGKYKVSKYSLTSSKDGGIKFSDEVKNESIVAYQTKQKNLSKIISQSKFDPEGKEK